MDYMLLFVSIMNKSVIQKKLQKSFIHKNSIINSAELRWKGMNS